MNLINLTNHPFGIWSEKQREEGGKYGGIIDYPFPNVDPDSTENEISSMADNIFADIIKLYGTDITVHIMGEFTLCYCLIKRFQKENISCIASCTERNVSENENGEKIVRFQFKKFRRYEQ